MTATITTTTASTSTASLASLPETSVTDASNTIDASMKEWRATLNLAFSPRPTKSVLTSARHNGPLRVQRAFYPEGGVPHVYILHPPGGIVAGDELAISIDVANKAHGLITTPSAGRVYRTNDAAQTQTQRVSAKVDCGGILEWFPPENIIFAGANGINSTCFNLTEGARLMAWDITCLGRPAGDLPFKQGRFVQRLQIKENGKPLLTERVAIDGGCDLMRSANGFQGFTVFATMVATVEDKRLLERLKSTLQHGGSDFRLAFTQQRSLLVARYLGHHAIQARELFSQAWHRVRPVVAGISACEPRIWHT